ncbi:MAG: GAF domain-containing protein [Acidobacteria bacterium]|nr:GAF domain-containing protein [Acidobacteriota bacterium]
MSGESFAVRFLVRPLTAHPALYKMAGLCLVLIGLVIGPGSARSLLGQHPHPNRLVEKNLTRTESHTGTLFGATPSLPQNLLGAKPTFHLFTDKDGLPQNTVQTMVFDREGYLWVGTQDGAAYYNGNHWTVVNMPNRTLSNHVRSMIAASDGSLWFGTNGGGVLNFQRDKWTVYDISTQALRNYQVLSLLETVGSNGNRVLWVGTNGGGLSRLENGTWTTFDTTSGLPSNFVMSLLETVGADGSKLLWVGTNGGGLACLNRGKWTVLNTASGLPSNAVFKLYESLDEDGTSTLWVGTNAGLARYTQGTWTIFDTRSGLPNDEIWDILEVTSSTGTRQLWVATFGGGIARLEQGQWKVVDTRLGLPDNLVFSLIESPAFQGVRSLWIGMSGAGLARLDQVQWTSLDTRSGLPNDRVRSILESKDSDGTPVYWIGTRNGLARLHQNKLTVFHTSDGMPGDLAMSLVETAGPNGTLILWVGTNRGLAKYEQGQWTAFNATNSGMPTSLVVDLHLIRNADQSETLWIGTFGEGLVRYERNQWQQYKPQTGFPSGFIMSLYETREPDGTSTLWVGTNGSGLIRIPDIQHNPLNSPANWQVLDVASGAIPNNVVRSLLETRTQDGDRVLWVGTDGGGLARLNLTRPEQKISVLSDTSAPALPNNTIYQICVDSQKRIYLSTNKGVARLTPRVPTPAQPAEFELYSFGTEDGLPSNECNGGASLVDERGRIWIGTVAGVAILDPAQELQDTQSKPLHLERTFLNGKQTRVFNDAPVATTTLDYWETNLVFEYALLSYFRESDTRYRTQLQGFDPEPTTWTRDTKKEYTNLSSGPYVFQIWARDYRGNVSGPLEIKFSIRPAPWETWWFGMLLLGMAAGLVYSGYELRLRTIRRRQEQRFASIRQLLESIRVINSQLDLTIVLQTITEESARLINAEPGGIGLLVGEEVVFKRLWNKGRWEDSPVTFKIGEGVAGKVAATARPVVVNNINDMPDLTQMEVLEKYEVQGLLDVPIINRLGQVVGVLDVRRKPGRVFTKSDCQLIESLAHQAAIALENAGLYGELGKLLHQEQEVSRALQELNQMKTNFIIVTSHEMRTPLTVLKGYTEALIEGTMGPLASVQQRTLITCQRMVDRLVSSFNDILEMLKINEGYTSIKPVTFDLIETINQVLNELGAFVHRRKQVIQCETPTSLPINADQEKIELVLLNIMQNAIKFTPDEGVIQIKVSTNGSGEIHLEIQDSGIGIDPAELTNIFEKFYTGVDPSTHRSGKYEFATRGTGLGLAIAKNYVEAHGGRIWAESAGKGQGSCFHIVLPASTSDTNVG